MKLNHFLGKLEHALVAKFSLVVKGRMLL